MSKPAEMSEGIDKLICKKCGEAGHYCEDQGWATYYLRCWCGHYPTDNIWPDSSGPYEEAERLLASNKKVNDSGDTAGAQCSAADLDSGIWCRAACSGLWYRNPNAAGEVDVVRVNGRTFKPPNDGDQAAAPGGEWILGRAPNEAKDDSTSVAPKTLQRPEVSSSELLDALTTALGYWRQNADKNSASNRSLDDRRDYEAQVFRRCKAALTRASNARICDGANQN